MAPPPLSNLRQRRDCDICCSSMGNSMNKDGTAQGIAKVRHQECLLPPSQQLYHDPYAYAMFSGSSVQAWMGYPLIDKMYRWMGLGGFTEMISIRTKWLDDQIVIAAKNKESDAAVKQLIILGAGYDTRGFRLDLWNDDENSNNSDDSFTVIEVDQPEVQLKKIANLQWIIKHNNEQEGKLITDRMVESNKVQYLPVDFNKDDLKEKLQSFEGFKKLDGDDCCCCSIITMEGVTQYIPKESSSDTLKKLTSTVGSGSTLLITYVDQKCFADDASLSKQVKWVKNLAARVGEPWISGWTPNEFEAFLNDCGYQVMSDTTAEDYNDTYLESVGRKLCEEYLWSVERYVVAKVK